MTVNLFRCALSSKHFEFEVFGSSKADALALFAAGIRQHAREYEDCDPEWVEDVIADARAYPVTAGVFTRDGSALKIAPPEPAQVFTFNIFREVTGQEHVARQVTAASRQEAEIMAARLCKSFDADCPDDVSEHGEQSFGDFQWCDITATIKPEA